LISFRTKKEKKCCISTENFKVLLPKRKTQKGRRKPNN